LTPSFKDGPRRDFDRLLLSSAKSLFTQTCRLGLFNSTGSLSLYGLAVVWSCQLGVSLTPLNLIIRLRGPRAAEPLLIGCIFMTSGIAFFTVKAWIDQCVYQRQLSDKTRYRTNIYPGS
jgi:ABC-type uncharacterized transport system permease subunit